MTIFSDTIWSDGSHNGSLGPWVDVLGSTYTGTSTSLNVAQNTSSYTEKFMLPTSYNTTGPQQIDIHWIWQASQGGTHTAIAAIFRDDGSGNFLTVLVLPTDNKVYYQCVQPGFTLGAGQVQSFTVSPLTVGQSYCLRVNLENSPFGHCAKMTVGLYNSTGGTNPTIGSQIFHDYAFWDSTSALQLPAQPTGGQTGIWVLNRNTGNTPLQIQRITFSDTPAIIRGVSAQVPLYGVNIAGGGFANTVWPTVSEMDHFSNLGMNIIRVAFLWNKMQPNALDSTTLTWNGSAPIDPTQLAGLKAVVDYAKTLGMTVILDLHSYATWGIPKVQTTCTSNGTQTVVVADASQLRIGMIGIINGVGYGAITAISGTNVTLTKNVTTQTNVAFTSPSIVMGNATFPLTAMADFWKLMAPNFWDYQNVIWGLMNEPSIYVPNWFSAVNSAIAAIRATGATQKIYVSFPGGGVPSEPAFATGLGIVDPINNYSYEVHKYFDANASGTTGVCVSEAVGTNALVGATWAARIAGKKLFLGEFGAGNNTTCNNNVLNVLQFMKDNSDVWDGWTYWAAGPWSPSYFTSVEPNSDGTDKPQISLLVQYVPSAISAQTINGLVTTATYNPSTHILSGTVTFDSMPRANVKIRAFLDGGTTSFASVTSNSMGNWAINIGALSGGHTVTINVSISSITLVTPTIPEMPLTPITVAASLPSYKKGVQLEGADYNGGPTKIFNQDYTYPTNSELDYFQSKGFSCVRIGFDIGRYYPKHFSPLNQAEISRLTGLVEHARQIGLWIIFDPHSYGAMYDDITGQYGSIGIDVPNEWLSDFWVRMATVYQNYPNVIYGLMNEPSKAGVTAQMWRAAAELAVTSIRAVSTTQMILIPGVGYTSARDWISNGNDVAWYGYSDPVGGPWAFDMHQYLDSDASGTHTDCLLNAGSTRLAAATAWLAANGYQAFLGEFAWPSVGGVVQSDCSVEGPALLDYMTANSGQWIGWCWFGSGPWAGTSRGTNLLPNTEVVGDQPQIATLLNYIP